MAVAGSRTRSLSCLAPEAVRPAGQYADADASATVIPHWDHERHVLSVGNRVVKQFRVPSPNQEAVLHAFQRDDWPPYIADPLPAVSAPRHAKVRLHDTIKCLNARQKNRLVRFHGDGQGMGVLWELVAEQAAQQAVRMWASAGQPKPHFSRRVGQGRATSGGTSQTASRLNSRLPGNRYPASDRTPTGCAVCSTHPTCRWIIPPKPSAARNRRGAASSRRWFASGQLVNRSAAGSQARGRPTRPTSRAMLTR